MKLTMKLLKDYAEAVNKPERHQRRTLFHNMHTMYEGGGRKLIEEKLKKEFGDSSTITEMSGRLVTVNILKKVIDKSAGVYVEQPSRFVVDENEGDSELLEIYEDLTRINSIQKEANRHIKMYKKCLKEPYIDRKGRPRLKVIQPFLYEVFHVNNPDVTQPDVIVKIIHDDTELEKQILHIYTDESFFIINGKGEVQKEVMALKEMTGRNPVKALPFVYHTTSTGSIDPIVETDALDISINIPIVLTDLFFACKYQCWSLIYTINVNGNINMNPSSVVSLTGDKSGLKPEIGTIKPEVDSKDVISMVESVINLFLSSKGLTTGTISTGTSAKDTVSGVSKMLDNAESVEDKKDQQDLFLQDENETWELLSKFMVPYWRRNQMLRGDINSEFSKDFIVAVVFKEPKAMLSEKDKIEMSVTKVEKKLSTRRIELKNLNPDLTDDQIENLIQEIKDEQLEFAEVAKQVFEMSNPQPTKPEDEKDGGKKSTIPNQSDKDIQ